MLIKNLDDTLVNGSIGTVMGFYTQAESNALEVTPSGIAPGTIYKELKELEEAEADVIPDIKPDVKSKADKNRYPLVRFLQRDGGFRTYLTTPESWKNELPNGEIVASRSQIVSISKDIEALLPCRSSPFLLTSFSLFEFARSLLFSLGQVSML